MIIRDLYDCSVDDISSSGYVVSTLEASIWSLLNTSNYEDAVIKAINLGDDTDTVGAVTGSMAGVLYGKDNIPDRWYNKLAKKEYLENLAKGFSKSLQVKNNRRIDDDMVFNHDQDLYNLVTSSPSDEKKTNK